MKLLKNLGWDKRSESQRRMAISHSSLEDLPSEYQETFQNWLDPQENIRHIITAPRQKVIDRHKNPLFRTAWTTTAEWWIVMTDQRVLVLTIGEDGSQPQPAEICFEDVLSMTLGKILLYGWVTWHWAQDNQPQSLQVFYNTVEEPLFAGMVNEICQYRIDQAGLSGGQRAEGLPLLESMPYKFRNIIANNLLLGDEQVESAIYSQASWSRKLILFRSLENPAMAMLRTNYHILVMREDYGAIGGKYGVVFQKFPLDTVRDVQLEEQEDQARINLYLEKDGVEETVVFSFNLEDNPKILGKLVDFCDGA